MQINSLNGMLSRAGESAKLSGEPDWASYSMGAVPQFIIYPHEYGIAALISDRLRVAYRVVETLVCNRGRKAGFTIYQMCFTGKQSAVKAAIDCYNQARSEIRWK